MNIKKIYLSILIVLIAMFLLNINANAIIVPKINDLKTTDSFIGKWKMRTIVTNSTCPEIIIGSTTESELAIEKLPNTNKLIAIWDGGIWSSSAGVIKPLSSSEALTERNTELNLDQSNNWKAILIDHMTLKEQNKIHTESLVKQYKNDIQIGEYKTFSILNRIE